MYTQFFMAAALSFYGSMYGNIGWAAAEAPQPQCDIPGQDLRSLPQKSAEACRDACTAEAACKAYNFISGWNRCVLKRQFSRKVTLRFYGGHIDKAVEAAGARSIAAARFDVDYSGKDLRKLPHTTNGEACGQACLAEASCAAFVYIAGYGDCWLKQTQGRLQEKIFYCGLRP